MKSQLEAATAVLDFSEDTPTRNKLCFKRLMEQKRSRNSRDLPLSSIGIAKLKKLMELGYIMQSIFFVLKMSPEYFTIKEAAMRN